MKTTDFAKTLAKYFSEYLPGIRNFSANSISSYRDTFKLLLNFFKEKGVPPEKLDYTDLTAEAISEFLELLESSRGCSISTRNQRLAAVHAFCRYAQTDAPERLLDLQKILQLPTKRCSRKTVPHLTTDQVRVLLEQPGQSTKAGRRNTVLLSILYDTGARVQQA